MASGYDSSDDPKGVGDVQRSTRTGPNLECTGFIRVGNFSEACTIEVSVEVMTNASPVFGRMFLNGGSVIFAGRTKRYIDLPGENAIVGFLTLKVLHGEKPWVDLYYEPHLLGLMADFAHRFDCLRSMKGWFVQTTWRCIQKIHSLRPRGTEATKIGALLRIAYLVKDAYSFYMISWMMFAVVEPEKVIHYTSLAGLTELVQRRMTEDARRYHQEMTGKLWPRAVLDIINPLSTRGSLDEWPPCRSRLIAYYIDALHKEGAFFMPKTLNQYRCLSKRINDQLPTSTCGHKCCQRTLKGLRRISHDALEVFREVRGVCIYCLENGDRSGCLNCTIWARRIQAALVRSTRQESEEDRAN